MHIEINGVDHQLQLQPRVTLLDMLRERLQFTGTKKGCNRGECGACTVLLDGRRVNACLVLAAAADGRKVTTIEGLADGPHLHPVQQAFIDHDAFQCGFCTCGQIMSAVGSIAEGHTGSNAGNPGVDERKPLSVLRLSSNRRRRRSCCASAAARGESVMRDFSYARPTSRAEAIALAGMPDTMVLAGGTAAFSTGRGSASSSRRGSSTSRGFPAWKASKPSLPNGGVRIGALAKLNDAAQHPLIQVVSLLPGPVGGDPQVRLGADP